MGVAGMFKNRLDQSNLQNVIFCILEDHNSSKWHNPDGNFRPFKSVFPDFAYSTESECELEQTESGFIVPHFLSGNQVEQTESGFIVPHFFSGKQVEQFALKDHDPKAWRSAMERAGDGELK